jgi:hypothetical protein
VGVTGSCNAALGYVIGGYHMTAMRTEMDRAEIDQGIQDLNDHANKKDAPEDPPGQNDDLETGRIYRVEDEGRGAVLAGRTAVAGLAPDVGTDRYRDMPQAPMPRHTVPRVMGPMVMRRSVRRVW